MAQAAITTLKWTVEDWITHGDTTNIEKTLRPVWGKLTDHRLLTLSLVEEMLACVWRRASRRYPSSKRRQARKKYSLKHKWPSTTSLDIRNTVWHNTKGVSMKGLRNQSISGLRLRTGRMLLGDQWETGKSFRTRLIHFEYLTQCNSWKRCYVRNLQRRNQEKVVKNKL